MTDDLLVALSSRPPKDKRTGCYYKTWLAQQTPERQAAVAAAMSNSKWKTTDLFSLLKEQGYEKQYNTLRMHRGGSCSCDQ
jgi:hypothetical protein